MVKKAVWFGLSEGLLTPPELYGLSDEGLFSLLSPERHGAFALAQRVREGRLFTLHSEVPFDSSLHGELEDLAKRDEAEARTAKQISRETGRGLSPLQVVIDLPEQTIFETELFVLGEICPFLESSSFFKGQSTSAFSTILRKVRIFVDAG
jgi:hypothetical protein